MGGLCSKQESDPFAQPGRRLDSAAPPARASAPTAPVPPTGGAKTKIGGPPRTLGGGGGGSAGGSSDADDARRRAAAAAEVSSADNHAVTWRVSRYAEDRETTRRLARKGRPREGNWRRSCRRRKSRRGVIPSKRRARRRGGDGTRMLLLKPLRTTRLWRGTGLIPLLLGETGLLSKYLGVVSCSIWGVDPSVSKRTRWRSRERQFRDGRELARNITYILLGYCSHPLNSFIMQTVSYG